MSKWLLICIGLLLPAINLLSVDLEVGVAEGRMVPEGSEGVIQLARAGVARANAVSYSPDGTTLAVGSSLGIHIYDAKSLEERYFVQTDSWVRALAFSPDGSIIGTGSYDPVVRLWRSKNGALLKELKGHTGWVRALAFAPDGNLLATASDDNTVRLWRVSDGKTVMVLDQKMEGVRAVAFSPNGDALATGGYDKIVRLWRVSDGALLKELQGHTAWVRALAFSPDGTFLASGGFDARILLWRLDDGSLHRTLTGHSASVLGLAFAASGKILASASVDTSIRLWEMPGGEPIDLLRGHSDFVYSVAFSRDGDRVASGAADNTVRVWEVAGEPSADPLPDVSSPTQCTACHHPLVSGFPPRVLETRCDACHDQSALVLNWCPLFPRSPVPIDLYVTPPDPEEETGVPFSSKELSVVIASPANGEVIYGTGGSQVPLPVFGHVYSDQLSDVEILMEIYSGEFVVASATTRPNPDGSFSFMTVLNSNGAVPFSARHGSIAGEARCFGCHRNQFDAELPIGEVLIQVAATNRRGVHAHDKRWITTDLSSFATIPIRVLLGDGGPVSGVPVEANTRLYQWRERTFIGESDGEGWVNLQVEALSAVPATYELSVRRVVIDGMFYRGVQPVEVTLPPGATDAPSVVLEVRSQLGQIIGHISGIQEPVDIWAIRLPEGKAFRTQTSPQGDFSFLDLPVDRYMIASDPKVLDAFSLALEPRVVDLTRVPLLSLDLSLSRLNGYSLRGRVTGIDETWLPFAWVSVGSRSTSSDPLSGEFHFNGLSAGKAALVVDAPGYYSRSQLVSVGEGAMDPVGLSLARRPETLDLHWGEGSLIIPPETVASVEGQLIHFEHGWIWGEGGSVDPYVIEWDGIRVQISGGRFAFERLPGQSAWLYLIEGEALILPRGEGVIVRSGEMVNLDPGWEPHPVPYDPLVASILRPSNATIPIPHMWQPTMSAQFQEGLAILGIGMAKAVTLITYVFVFLILSSVPVLAIRLIANRRERPNE